LDDCTANLDAQTEANLWERIRDSFGDCTILLVTHRPRTLQQADAIVVLDGGSVREGGTFLQLDRPNTRFHSLYTQWKLQEATGD
jgi:ABC-type multidrug transport system fused ATPase/permease subunit